MRAPIRHHGVLRQLTRTTVAATAAAVAVSLIPGSAIAATPTAADTAVEVPVRLKVADRAAEKVATPKQVWPATMLSSRGVKVDHDDLIDVVRKGRHVKGDRRRLRQGDTVKVIRVKKDSVIRRVRIAPGTVTVSVTSLKPGRRKVVAPGRPGVRRVKVARTRHNGDVVKRRVVSRTTVRAAKPRRVLVGRKAAPVAASDGLNWTALAKCESGGNPRAVNPAGYYGLYQFDIGTWRSVGGRGMPSQASPAEQTLRAKILHKSRGSSPWPYCGRFL
ncbi:resuscitation-promoting factor [Nocardioides sp. 616]|uniref:resuscitation-promoting factor n=1 Tax=Nocardioides sp. 616 TaxID=2268090 RepID=UPI000CE30067|nr:resuscitation-promoting factor [Nocardioides sp. 616]